MFLPEYALLLADRSGNALKLRAVECDPAIVTLPGASAAPLPPPSGLSHGGVPPILINQDQARPAVAPGSQYQTGWQESGDLEAEPAWSDEQPEVPWWRRNQPPDQRP